jgi:hypothetical protein
MALNRSGRRMSLAIAVFVVSGCASFDPVPLEEVGFLARSQTQQQGDVTLTTAVPSAEECVQAFGVNLYKKNVQPVWLEITNNDSVRLMLMPAILDPEYFAPLEVAAAYSFGSEKANEEVDRFFAEQDVGVFVPPGETRSGFVFTNVDEGTKSFVVELVGADHEYRRFTFFVEVPGLNVDHRNINFGELYAADEIVTHDLASLRRVLEELPCCTTNKSGKGQGDPLNLVVIGEPLNLYYAFMRAGWDETETIYRGSLLKTMKSFVFGGRYRYSPVSALYVFGRGQDVALQKARDTIHERNHLRLWLTPLRLNGKAVWVGQISRDIGVRFTRKTITTHKIDPDVDEARNYLVQDLWYSQVLAQYSYVAGVGAAAYGEPRGNLTGDPYFTDGLRAVMWLSGDPLDMEEVEFLNWEMPPTR